MRVCENFGEIWFGIRFEIRNLGWEKSGEIFGEDFSACQESTGNFRENSGANFGANFEENIRKLRFKVRDFFRKLRSAERAVLKHVPRMTCQFLGPATTQNLVVKFDGEICGGVLVKNVSDDFSPAKEAWKSPSKLCRKFATNFANFTLEIAGA